MYAARASVDGAPGPSTFLLFQRAPTRLVFRLLDYAGRCLNTARLLVHAFLVSLKQQPRRASLEEAEVVRQPDSLAPRGEYLYALAASIVRAGCLAERDATELAATRGSYRYGMSIAQ